MVHAGRDVVLVGADADEEGAVAGGAVLPCEACHVAFDFELALMVGQAGYGAFEAGGDGDVGVEIVHRLRACEGEHLRAFIGREGKVAHQRFSQNLS
jgi:hypothetical protein